MNALVLVILLSVYYSSGSSDDNCIGNYGELKNSILNNTENTEDLLRGFYPPNQSPSHVVTIYYYIQPISDNTTNGTVSYDQLNNTASYTYRWVDSSSLLLTEWQLFDALSFGISKLNAQNMSIIITPFCNEDEAINLLNMATVWVSFCFITNNFIYLCS